MNNLLFTSDDGFDTRKVINRSNKVIGAAVIEQIEHGVTIETLEETLKNVPFFKYRKQITIHGVFSGIDLSKTNNYYKGVVLNGNKTLGIRWSQIDLSKKLKVIDTINKVSNLFFGKVTSTECVLTSNTLIHNDIEAQEAIKKYRTVIDRLPKDIFGGFCNIETSAVFGIGKFIIATISIEYLYQKNITRFIEAVTGLKEQEYIAIIDKQERASKEQALKYNIEYNKVQAAAKELHDSRLKECLSKYERIITIPAVDTILSNCDGSKRIKIFYKNGKLYIHYIIISEYDSIYNPSNKYKSNNEFNVMRRKYSITSEHLLERLSKNYFFNAPIAPIIVF